MIEVECHACGALYGIPEERARGRVLKIRCKDCTNVFEVRGEVAPDEVPEWFAVIDKRRVGPMSRLEVVERRDKGEILSHTFLWREGMEEWLRCSELSEFSAQSETENTSLGPSENTRRIRHPDRDRPIKILRDSPAAPAKDETLAMSGVSRDSGSHDTVDVSSDMALAATQHVQVPASVGGYADGRDDDSFPTDRFGNSVPTEKVQDDSLPFESPPYMSPTHDSVGMQGRRSRDPEVHLADSDILGSLRAPTEDSRREPTEIMSGAGKAGRQAAPSSFQGTSEDTNRIAVNKLARGTTGRPKSADDQLDDLTERVSPLHHGSFQPSDPAGSGLGRARLFFGIVALGLVALAAVYLIRPELFSVGPGVAIDARPPSALQHRGDAKTAVATPDAPVERQPVAVALDADAPASTDGASSADGSTPDGATADIERTDQSTAGDAMVADGAADQKRRVKKRRWRRKKKPPAGGDELDTLMNDGP